MGVPGGVLMGVYCVHPQKLHVPPGQPPGAECHDLVLPGLGVSLDPHTSLVPTFWLIAELVL